jgi:hypothetical protein
MLPSLAASSGGDGLVDRWVTVVLLFFRFERHMSCSCFAWLLASYMEAVIMGVFDMEEMALVDRWVPAVHSCTVSAAGSL